MELDNHLCLFDGKSVAASSSRLVAAVKFNVKLLLLSVAMLLL